MSTSPQRVRAIPKLPQRAPDAHKGCFGRVLVLGGSSGMIGAPALVALSALRSGAGLVTIAVPAAVQPTVAGLCPCATTIAVPQSTTGQIDPAETLNLFKNMGMLDEGTKPDVLVTGPGVGQGSQLYGRQLWELINAFRNDAKIPAVIDADALNLATSGKSESPAAWDNQPHFKTVITPHPGELARMHGVTTRQIQADREGFAVRTAEQMNAQANDPDHAAVVVLKGAGTIVTDGKRLFVNETGNPGLATGGSGDVLAGVVTALIGQGLGCFDAAVLGVHVHGLAGDLAANMLGQISLIATDIIESLPSAFVKLT